MVTPFEDALRVKLAVENVIRRVKSAEVDEFYCFLFNFNKVAMIWTPTNGQRGILNSESPIDKMISEIAETLHSILCVYRPTLNNLLCLKLNKFNPSRGVWTGKILGIKMEKLRERGYKVVMGSLKDYPVVRFSIQDATGESYSAFIIELRNRLATGDDVRHGILVLPQRVDISRRFVLVELTNSRGYTATLALDVINVYVVGYRAGDTFIFFQPDNDDVAHAIPRLFVDARRRHMLSFTGGYGDIENREVGDRDQINLGRQALDDAVTFFEVYANRHGSENNLRRAFLVSIQMISEAARFQYISSDMSRRIRRNQERPPSPSILRLENSWGPLSEEIQMSNQGVFRNRIQLQRDDYSLFYVDRLSDYLVQIFGLMLFQCAKPSKLFSVLTVLNSNDGVCEYQEPTVRIIGPTDLCAAVYNGWWHNGNPIVLWPCKTNTDADQLWTLKRDGTIRANNKCLTADGSFSPGSYIMIYDCDSAAEGATRWKARDDGTIINPISRLVLGIKSPIKLKGETLFLQTNANTTLQSWHPTNIIQPFMSSIVGLNGLCLQANVANVWVEECVSSKKEQQWAFYSDGSIRTSGQQLSCLTARSGSVVELHLCTDLIPGQRWAFKRDGTIWNLEHGLVLDVKGNDPSLKERILWSHTGNPNQKWMIRF
ncbi:ricin-like [Mercurialis annua]|uniref:ricin-like n=1 Tax=Mercurialis annua TaxID=3986 RepID=UPI00215F0C16|nr:ricin-like [Mercurialis annua]